MKFLILFSLLLSSVSFADTKIQCPDRYPNGNRLIDGDVLRYQNGNRLIDGDVWRYDNGNRLVDGDVWRYKNGNRLIDGDVWRYENGNRLVDGDVIRYPSGNRMREPDGTFRSDNGTKIGGDFFQYVYSATDGMTIKVELTKQTETFTVILESEEHFYEIAYSDAAAPQPESLKCLLNTSEVSNTFRLNSNAATAEVTVKAGHDAAGVKAILQKAMDSIESGN